MNPPKSYPEDANYAIYKLPESLSAWLARKLVAINIEAIRSSPKRVLPYTAEYMKDTEHWLSQLKDPRRTVWICVAPNAKTGSTSLEEGHWVGMIRLWGPLSLQEYYDFTTSGEKGISNDSGTRWRIGRLFIAKSHRSVGLLDSLFMAVLDFVEKASTELGRPDHNGACGSNPVRFQMQGCAYYNSIMHRFHEANGAKVIAHLTEVQTFGFDQVLNGVPQDLLSEDDHSKPAAVLFEFTQKRT